MNDPNDWGKSSEPQQSHLHATYPLDGRDTIYEPYENIAPTDTVGRYLAAAARVQARDPNLPRDFGAYLAQRVPSARHFASISPETIIGRNGRLEHGAS